MTTLFVLDDLVAAAGAAVTTRLGTEFTGVSIDGRTAAAAEVYFAVRGESLDGHRFLGQAAAAGATGVVVERGRSREAPPGVTVVEVDDTRIALAALGRFFRRRWNRVVVGITGSAGKTTTKELVAAMLGAGLHGPSEVLATEGSLNNETGVPLTLARLRPTHKMAVIEMGMRAEGQIDYLAKWVEPDVGLVTNAGIAHVGIAGSVEAIARGKSEIWGRLRAPGGVAVYPHGDARLAAQAAARVPPERRVTFGPEPEATVRVESVTPRGIDGSDLQLLIRPVHGVAGGPQRVTVHVPLVGRHNADNAAAAMAVATALAMDPAVAARGLATARPARHRSELAKVGGRHILVDCYNANPASMRAALATLRELAGDRRAVAVLGDMLDLGTTEIQEHQSLGRALGAHRVDHLVAMGARSRHTARAAEEAGVDHVVETEDPMAAARVVASWTDPDDWILIKASRGMRLERVLEALRAVVT